MSNEHGSMTRERLRASLELSEAVGDEDGIKLALHALGLHNTVDSLAAERDALRTKYDCAHAELLAIHEIACCGYANALRHPITPDDTMTLRGVKIMAAELICAEGQQT